MPFLSNRDERARLQKTRIEVLQPDVDFYEGFAASVGLAIDEDLSISSALNREGWEQRRQFTSELISEGKINRDEYTDRRGRFDYNRLAESGLSENIKTDAMLKQERNELLAQRRSYAESVIERSSGLAQFLGMANAFVLDPVNIATYPIATAGSAVKGLGALARAGMVARNEAALAIVAETGIQALVYEHKQDIESPYTMQDAIVNIAAGAAGAALLGGAIGGISGYFRKAAEIGDVEPKVKAQAEQLIRMAEDMEQNPVRLDIDESRIESEFIEELKAELIANSSQKLTRGERKNLKTEADLSRLEQGIIPERLQPELKNRINDEYIKADQDYLEQLELKRQQVNNTKTDPEIYNRPVDPVEPESATVTSDQSEVLQSQGLKTDYDRDMQAYNELKVKRTIVDGELVDAEKVMKALDDELKGLDEIKVCAIG